MSEKIEKIANLVHEVNRAFFAYNGDFSHKRWEDAEEWEKSDLRTCIEKIVSGKVESPEQLHDDWLKLKELDGWKYGSTENLENKTHSFILPYQSLSPDQKMKYKLTFFTAMGYLNGNRTEH